MEQLRELVARIMSRPLDTARPLWEVYFIEGLQDGCVAVLSKSHQILVDGVQTVDIGQVLLDTKPEPKELERYDWAPRRAPSPFTLTTAAIKDNLVSPSVLLATGQSVADGAVRRAAAAQGRFAAVANAMANRRPAPESPIHAELSEPRRFVPVPPDLEAHPRTPAEQRARQSAEGGKGG